MYRYVIFLLFFYSCTPSSTKDDLSLKLGELPNAISITDAGSAKIIELIPEVVIGDDDKLILGYLSQIEIDSAGRVYLADWRQKQIHVFDKNGDYITALGREGVGPGEFQGFSHMKIKGNKLSVFDRRQFRINEFNLETLSYSNSTTVRQYPRNVGEYEEIKGWIPMYFIPRYDSTTIAGYMEHPKDSRIELETYNLGEYRGVKYYFMNYSGEIISDQLFEMRDREDLMATVEGKHLSRVQPAAFLGNTILRVSPEKEMISVWTKDFIIKIYDSNGNYERALYHASHSKRTIRREELIEFLHEDDWNNQLLVKHAELPEKWPSLFTIKIDDENRIWVGLIKEGEQFLEWWVITQQGDLVAKAYMPEDLSLKWLMSDPLLAIRDGYFYASKRDPDTGQELVVKYKMEYQ
ncbi:MAG: 6-bladed beta-propeller [Gracilimonas sp.]|uniref:6-bladed beta-propeller n=1 Tax=Gracilimonas sp. TaxID=1974203 RepID=UPI0019960FCA|nr:6-bladed beta-propeller [Gracilimonas sp.]MBD3614926.1 6-bladed beta-propeller [Gracilimonas sp.]